ncbi:MAG: ATP-binding protein [Thermoplasmata archaeon]
MDNLPGYAFILEKDSREIIYSNDKAKEVGAVPGETCFENVAERDDPCPFCKAPETWETDERREIEIEYRGTYYYGIWIPYTDDLYVHYIFDITERKKAERQIEENEEKLEKLHQISAELETCDSQEEVYSLVVKVAERVLDLDICAINVPDGDVMKATAVSSEFPEGASSVKKPLPIDDSLAGKTYREKRSFLVRDKKENKYVNPTSDEFVSGISVPIGDFAVFQACSNKVDDFDEDDLKMTELLMDHVSQALKRVEIKEREEFLHSLLRHDVQNKTQLVKGYLHLLEEDVDVPDEAKDYIQKAKKVTRLSDEIIEKVRKLKQIAQKDEIGEVEIDPVLDQVLSEHESQLEKESIAFKVKTSRCKVKGGALLQEAISNLIENSILHSDCDKIRIQAGCEEGECVVTVEDDGKGISDEVKEKIFDRGFKKGENAGSGLGMYLVKDIVESYGGSVEAKDSELGGARFDVHLHRME